MAGAHRRGEEGEEGERTDGRADMYGQILNLAGVALASGLVELGFGAKSSKMSQDGIGKNIKALEAFTILSGAASALVGTLFVLAGDKPSQ